MIELINVSKNYPNGIDALHDINLTIGKEEFVFLVGSSGAGKTTLLKLLYREERPTSGKVVVDRVNVVRPRFHIRCRTCGATSAWFFRILSCWPKGPSMRTSLLL